MVVLHLISGGETGGSKNHLISLVKEMKNRKVKNIIVCLIKGELYNEAKSLGIDVRLVEQNKRFDLGVISKIKDICIKENVDIINSHGGRANFLCYFLKSKYKAKYITTVHSDYESDYKGNKYKTLIYSNINKLSLKRFDYYIAVSSNFKSLLIKRGFKENKIFTVYNGIDTKKDKKINSKSEILNKYNIKDFENYIVMVARLHPIKGHKEFFDACEKISNQLRNTGIILVGDGLYKSSLEEYIRGYKIENNIKFVGFQEPEDFFNLADFTVLTSYSESFPLVILESGLYGRAVIASNVGGIGEIIKSNENGLLVEARNVESISNAIEKLIENKELSNKMGKNLQKDVKEKFSIEQLSNSYEKIWNAILMEE